MRTKDLRHLVIGMGQIGTAIYEVLSGTSEVYARDIKQSDDDDMDVLHICFPYYDGFIYDVAGYIEQYDPELTIIYSTVPIGTSRTLGNDIVHSPVEGKHPNLAESIKKSPRWLGCVNNDASNRAASIWLDKCTGIRQVVNSDITEWLKLRSTAKYGVNLVWAEYEDKVNKKLNANPQIIKDFDMDYNRLYQDLRLPQFQRYILDPPNGEIGGHCVVPNAELLNAQYPNVLLQEIIKMKPKRRKK